MTEPNIKTTNPPQYLAIDISSYCNLNCSMCFRRGIPNLKPKFLSLKKVRIILDKVKPQRDIVIVGIGEPMLNPEFLEIIKEIRGRDLQVNMVTNGTLLTPEISEQLVRLKIKKISISLDSPVKETYEEIRKGSNYETVMNNIRKLTEIKYQLKSGSPYVRIDMVGMTSNIHQLPMLIKLAHFLKANGVHMLHLQALTEELGKLHLNNVKKEELYKHYAEAIASASALSIDLQLRPFEPVCAFCYSPWNDPYIDIDGNISICCLPGGEKLPAIEYYLDAPVKIYPEKLWFGNIFEEDFEKIWMGEKMENFRKYMLELWNKYKDVDWTQEKYLELRKNNPDPVNYCLVCARRFQMVC